MSTIHDLCRLLTDREIEELLDTLESKKTEPTSDNFPAQWRNEDLEKLMDEIQGERTPAPRIIVSGKRVF